ncbi:hypothetical protein [Acinetobacter sp. CFCC 10889]|uniref:hypothetical protein n=1 Tax=Acinetobacter sp. CFCC 10889 TaxID=1775557 RepID=UPI000DD0B24A|nr:hypothetical protein [Acinetobacter sp. CFCC 10889]
MKKDDEKKPINLGHLNLETLEKLTNGMDVPQSNQKDDDLMLKELDELLGKNPKIDNILSGDAMRTKNKSYDFNFLRLSVDQVKDLPTNELLKLLSGESHDGSIHETTIQLISNEILSRQIKASSKPHWNVYAILVLTFVAAAASVIALLK